MTAHKQTKLDQKRSDANCEAEAKAPPALSFTLHAGQVPERPVSNLWVDQLRWLVCVMNTDDNALHFISSVLSHVLKNGGLSAAQGKVAESVLDRIAKDHAAGILHCQILVPGFGGAA